MCNFKTKKLKGNLGVISWPSLGGSFGINTRLIQVKLVTSLFTRQEIEFDHTKVIKGGPILLLIPFEKINLTWSSGS